MRHLLKSWDSRKFITLFLRGSRLHNGMSPGCWPKGKAQTSMGEVWTAVALGFSLAMITALFPDAVGAQEKPPTESERSEVDRNALQQIQTILLTGTIRTWLDVPAPPYNVAIVLKLKLEDAGFQVVFDSDQPHDAKLRIHYEELPSGHFKILEQGTSIRYEMQLVHERLGEIFSRQFTAEPNEIPIGSLYWDTVSNLEEDPYYCFVGDLIVGQIHHGQRAQEILLEVLLRPFTHPERFNAAGSRAAVQAAVKQNARLNLIQELGQGLFNMPEAQEALWTLAQKAQPNERGAAMTQLGRIGDSSFLLPMARLLEKEENPEVRSAGEHAMSLIQSR